jgi:hypothetical protein
MPIEGNWQATMGAQVQGVENVAVEIGRYLHKHPDAADSVEGVRHWWLSAESSETSLAVVSAALEKLIAQGAVKLRVLADGTKIYSGNPRRQPKDVN